MAPATKARPSWCSGNSHLAALTRRAPRAPPPAGGTTHPPPPLTTTSETARGAACTSMVGGACTSVVSGAWSTARVPASLRRPARLRSTALGGARTCTRIEPSGATDVSAPLSVHPHVTPPRAPRSSHCIHLPSRRLATVRIVLGLQPLDRQGCPWTDLKGPIRPGPAFIPPFPLDSTLSDNYSLFIWPRSGRSFSGTGRSPPRARGAVP
jgi:hypothetical protein